MNIYTWYCWNKNKDCLHFDIEAETAEDASRILYNKLKNDGMDEYNNRGRLIKINGKHQIGCYKLEKIVKNGFRI